MTGHLTQRVQALAVILLVLCLQACAPGDSDLIDRQQEIVIAVAWPFSVTQPQLWEGVVLAQEEINQGGGVLGYQIRLLRYDDESSVRTGRVIAQQIVDNPEPVVAVIGHYNSSVSIPASAIYQFADILMLSPGSTNPQLTQQGFDLVFRNIPTDNAIGRQLAHYAQLQGYQRMVILSAKDTYGIGLANILETESAVRGIDIVDRLSYLAGSDRAAFVPIVETWKQLDFDAIFIAGTMPEAGHFMRVARQAGIDAPVLAGDGLATEALWQVGGLEETEGTVVSSPFHPDSTRLQVHPFVSSFEAKYGYPPDAWAAQGYDALHLLAYAMQKAESFDAHDLRQALLAVKDWPGVTGRHTFDEKGDVVDKPVVLEQVHEGAFVYLTEMTSTTAQ
jgi:branched-chain amino acid transport system substrate-binding protein